MPLENKSQHFGKGDIVGRDKNIQFFFPKILFLIIIVIIVALIGYYFYNKHNIAKQSAENATSVKYVSIVGQTLDLLLDSNKINSPEFAEVFGEKPIILPTQALFDLQKIKKQYSIDISNYREPQWQLKLIKKNVTTISPSRLRDFTKADKVLPSVDPILKGYERGVFGMSETELIAHYQPFIKMKPINPLQNYRGAEFTFSKSASVSDVDYMMKYAKQEYKQWRTDPAYHTLLFYKSLIQKEFPNEFIRITGRKEYGCSDVMIYMNFTVPVLKMKVMYIKNISSSDIRLDKLLFEKNNFKYLRTITQDVGSIFDTISLNKIHVILRPEQSLVIPLYSYLQPLPYDFDYSEPETFKEINDTAHEYVFKTSLFLSKYNVNDYSVKLSRNYELSDYGVFVNGIEEVGSCPYAYTYSADNNKFILENHILYLKNSQKKEGWDTLKLERFNGKIQVKEIDPETSFIDCINILEVKQDGTKSLLYPDIKSLCQKDSKHYKMSKGDKAMLSFNAYKACPGAKYYLLSYGYYLPFQNKKSLTEQISLGN